MSYLVFLIIFLWLGAKFGYRFNLTCFLLTVIMAIIFLIFGRFGAAGNLLNYSFVMLLTFWIFYTFKDEK